MLGTFAPDVTPRCVIREIVKRHVTNAYRMELCSVQGVSSFAGSAGVGTANNASANAHLYRISIHLG